MGRGSTSDEASVEDVDEPRLTVSGAARRLGIAPATLRTWDRRYGIGPTGHARGRHRRYSAADMARLELMQRALMQGAAPAEAARYARTTAPSAASGVGARPAGDHRRTDGADTRSSRRARCGRPPVTGAPRPRPRRGRSVPADAGCRAAGARARPGRAGDGPDRGRTTWWRTRSPRTGWSPRGTRWRARSWPRSGTAGRPPVVAWRSSTCSASASSRCSAPGRPLRAPPDPVPAPARPVLLAAMPTELHVVPLAVLAALLAERGVGCRSLGAALPADALAAAVRRTAPAAVVLWSQLAVDGRPGRRDRAAGHPAALPDLRRGPRLGRRRAAGGGGRARAPSSTRASGSAPPYCGEWRSVQLVCRSGMATPSFNEPAGLRASARVKIAGRSVHRVG